LALRRCRWRADAAVRRAADAAFGAQPACVADSSRRDGDSGHCVAPCGGGRAHAVLGRMGGKCAAPLYGGVFAELSSIDFVATFADRGDFGLVPGSGQGPRPANARSLQCAEGTSRQQPGLCSPQHRRRCGRRCRLGYGGRRLRPPSSRLRVVRCCRALAVAGRKFP